MPTIPSVADRYALDDVERFSESGAWTDQPLDDVTSYLREERAWAVWKLPERLHVVDALAMTASGEVREHQLRELVLG